MIRYNLALFSNGGNAAAEETAVKGAVFEAEIKKCWSGGKLQTLIL